MDSQRVLLYLFFILYLAAACLICPSDAAYSFRVGGKDGWTLNPSENYNHWAGRMRFQVNDTLSFQYPKGSDSVLEVNEDDYDKCNTSKPILKLDRDSVFPFDRSGPFFFITGNKSNCDQGQKLHIIVLAIRNNNNPPLLVPSPSPTPNNPPPPPTPAAVPPAPATAPSTSFAPAVSPSLVLLSLVVGVALGSFITT